MFNKVEINEKQQVHDAISNLLINRSGEWFTTTPDSNGETMTFHTSLVSYIKGKFVTLFNKKDELVDFERLTKEDINRLIDILKKHQSIQNNIINSRINEG